MKTKILILFAIIVVAHCNVSLHAQEPIPDTVWTKTFQNPITINCVKFSPDGQYIFAGTNNVILQIESATGNIFRSLSGHTDQVYTISFSPTGDTILSMGMDRTIRLWNYQNGDPIYSLKYERPDSLNIKLGTEALLAPDGRKIISLTGCNRYNGDKYENIYIFDIETKKLITGIGDFPTAFNIAISPDGRYFAMHVSINNVLLFDLNTYQLIKVLGSHESQVNDIAFSPDGKMVASCGEDWRIYVWDTETRELIHEYGCNTHVKNVVFSNDSKFIIWSDGGDNYTTQVWSIDTKEKVYQYPFSGFADIDISQDNKIITTSSKRVSLLNPKWEITGFQETNEYETIIYPNPTNNSLTVNFNLSFPTQLNFNLYDITGILVSNIKSQFYEPGLINENLILGNLANGVYYLKIESLQCNKTFKININK